MATVTTTATPSPAPTSGLSAPPSAAATPAAPHPADEKQIALVVDEGLKNASKCDVDRALRGRTFPVTITVTNDGRLHAQVHIINISRPNDDFEELWAAPRGECIPAQFESLDVPAFDGPAVVVERRLKMH